MTDWSVVRCSRGAYYETVWVPLMSLKAVRLGATRIQRCPVHQRWERACRVPDDQVTPQILADAAQYRDSGVP